MEGCREEMEFIVGFEVGKVVSQVGRLEEGIFQREKSEIRGGEVFMFGCTVVWEGGKG